MKSSLSGVPPRVRLRGHQPQTKTVRAGGQAAAGYRSEEFIPIALNVIRTTSCLGVMQANAEGVYGQMKKEMSPALIGGVIVAVVLLLGGIYWMVFKRGEAGLPAEGQPGNQPPAIKGITPVNPSVSRPR